MARAPLALDELDHKLLGLLQRDAAATLTALGDAIGLSPSAVQRRLTRYRKHGLLRQVALLTHFAEAVAQVLQEAAVVEVHA